MTNCTRDFITVVSGLPRSGTSLMMQMLAAGGIPPLTDQLRASDEDNPRGYFEFERIKQLKTDQGWLPDAIGKAVKIVHLLLKELPSDFEYRVLFMNRSLDEVVRSQSTMLSRAGKPGGSLSPERLKQVYANQLASVRGWLAAQPRFQILDVSYADLVRTPESKAREIDEFLGGDLDIAAMTAAVDPRLYRNRSESP